MKRIILGILILMSINCFSQLENTKATIFFYRPYDLSLFNSYARVLINDSLILGVGTNEIHTISLPSGSFEVSLFSQPEKKLFLIFEAGKNYYFKILHHYGFFFGKYELLQVTPEFAASDLKENIYRKKERILINKK